jgi:glyceraldehyde-3-phosphate dehydrogenase (NAD(P))
MAVKVLVNGFGTIGKRVAEAITLQKDVHLVGISDVSPTSTLNTALKGYLRGTKLYCSVPGMEKNLGSTGLNVSGTLEELLDKGKVDVVVDATPAGIDEKNKPLYERTGVKAIFQGGASKEIAPVSFNSLWSYDRTRGKQFARVVSCNTTSLARTLYAIDKKFKIEFVFASLIRRATDPLDSKKGPVNAIVPVMHVPSHHGPDLQTVAPEMDIETMAVTVPTTLAHVHLCAAKVPRKKIKNEEVVEAFRRTPRIKIMKAADGYASTAEIVEHFRDLGRKRYDIYETIVWEETVDFDRNRIYWINMVHQEAIVVPENIDCIRAMCELEKSNMKSIRKTDKAMGIE